MFFNYLPKYINKEDTPNQKETTSLPIYLQQLMSLNWEVFQKNDPILPMYLDQLSSHK